MINIAVQLRGFLIYLVGKTDKSLQFSCGFAASDNVNTFLFAAFFVVEAIAHRAASGMSAMLARAGRMGPLIGALLGCVPQCGFSVMASELYVSGVVTLGTLLSVYLSTSDEAVIILLANPGHLKDICDAVKADLIHHEWYELYLASGKFLP